MRSPPSAPLCSSETLAAVECDERVGKASSELASQTQVCAYLGQADVDNSFRRIQIDEELGQMFTLPYTFTAKELAVAGQVFQGKTLEPTDRVRVCCAALPMGFGWSLYFAQRINAYRMSMARTLQYSR